MHPISNIQPLSSQAMRIGLDAKRAFNNGTGLGNYSRFIINGLIKHFPEHEYYLFTPSINPEFEQFYVAAENVKLITPESLLGEVFSSLWRTYSLAQICTQLKLDVFHGLSNELPIGIEKFTGKKIVTIHDLIFLRYPDYYNNIDRYIYTKKFKHAAEKSDIILATSVQTQKDIVYHFNTPETKIKIGYQNCDSRFDDTASDSIKNEIALLYRLPKQFILCVGTIEQRKNQLTVLKAFGQLADSTCQLIFIGKQTDYAKQLHSYIAQNQLTEKVVFLQQIPTAHLPIIYQLASVFVYASEFEGFGIPVLEAMRSGIPVIAANASSLPEVGGNAIAYFEPNDTTRLTRLMEQLLKHNSDTSLYQHQLMLFDTQKIITSLEQLYHN